MTKAYIFIALWHLTSKVPTVLYFRDIVSSTRKQQSAYLRFSKRIPNTYFILLHHWQHSSIQTTINPIKPHWFCLWYTGKYSTRSGVSKPHTVLGYALCCMNFSSLNPIPCAIFPIHTRTDALTNTHTYIYICIYIDPSQSNHGDGPVPIKSII